MFGVEVIEGERRGGPWEEFWVAASRVARIFPCHVLGFNPTFWKLGKRQVQEIGFPKSYYTQGFELGGGRYKLFCVEGFWRVAAVAVLSAVCSNPLHFLVLNFSLVRFRGQLAL